MLRNLARILTVLPALALAACATPEIDRTVIGFDPVAFQRDLDDCSGGPSWANALTMSDTIAMGAFTGFVVGAGAMGGDANGDWRVLAGGAAIGGLAGFCLGASAAYEERRADVAACLQAHGYRLLEPVSTERRDKARKFFRN